MQFFENSLDPNLQELSRRLYIAKNRNEHDELVLKVVSTGLYAAPGDIITVKVDQAFLDSSKIRGSDDYYERGRQDFLEGVLQGGQIFIFTELTDPLCSDGITASQLVLNGDYNVSCDYDYDCWS